MERVIKEIDELTNRCLERKEFFHFEELLSVDWLVTNLPGVFAFPM